MEIIQLYKSISNIVGRYKFDTGVWLIIGLMYINIFLYIMDLYELVKKKTAMETVMVMLLPGSVTVIAAVFFALGVDIPASGSLDTAWEKHFSSRLCLELLCLAAVFALVWAGTWLAWRKRRENRFRAAQWIFSYSLDFIMMAALVIESASGLVFGTDLFGPLGRFSAGMGIEYNFFLYLFVYGIAALVLKMGLMLMAALVRVYSKRIPFRYRESSNPYISYLLYVSVFQNALVRGALAFWLPMAAGFTVLCVTDAMGSGYLVLKIELLGIIYVGFLLYLLMALRPVVECLERFEKWGDNGQAIKQFCREYFMEEPFMKNADFVVTRHFLVDERGAAVVYYFEALADNNKGWGFDKKGWVRHLRFLDGSDCEISKEDLGAEEVFRYAEQYREIQHLSERNPAQQYQQEQSRVKEIYQRILQFAIAIAVLLICVGPRFL